MGGSAPVVRPETVHTMTAPSQGDSRDANGESLEQRVCRLEEAVAAIQDTQIMEDRVVERVVHRVEHFGPPSGPGIFAGAARMLLPRTTESAENGTANGVARNGRPTGAAGIFLDLRSILRMLGDYRYRMSWTGRIVLVSAIVICILSWLLLAGLPLVGGIVDRIVLILAAVITFKAMEREVGFYQERLSRIRR
jgi:hypothetical protein